MEREKRGPRAPSWRDQMRINERPDWADPNDMSPEPKQTSSGASQQYSTERDDGNLAVIIYLKFVFVAEILTLLFIVPKCCKKLFISITIANRLETSVESVTGTYEYFSPEAES